MRHYLLCLLAALTGIGWLRPVPTAKTPSVRRRDAPQYEIVDLGAFTPTGINSRQHVMGHMRVGGDVHAVVWCDGGIQDLGTLGHEPPGHWLLPLDMSERGQIVGCNRYGANGMRAFLWHHGVLHDLGSLVPRGQAQVIASAISHVGHVVGESDAPPAGRHAFLWRDGAMTDLGTLGGGVSRACDVNARGQVVGWSDGRAFLWEGGLMRDLGGREDGGNGGTGPLKINERGQVTGTDGAHAFVWSDGALCDIGTLGEASSSIAVAINNRGQVAGNSGLEAFLWDEGALRSLGTLGGESSHACAMNDLTQICGTSQLASGAGRAFLWEHGEMYDLGTLAGGQSAAVAINRRGDVAGSATLVSGQSRAVMWRRAGSGPRGGFLP